MEQLDVTTPITAYRVSRLILDWDNALIEVRLRSTVRQDIITYQYGGQTATDLMKLLNTIDNSVTSLHKRIISRLVADGVIAGTISGAPD